MTTPTSSPARSTWKLTSPSALLAWALAAFLLFLGVRGLVDPVGAADGFGLPIHGADALPWLRIKADRDLALGLMLVTLILARHRRSFGAVALVSAVSPTVDGLTVIAHGMRSVGYALSVHGSAVVYCLALGAWLLWSGEPALGSANQGPVRRSSRRRLWTSSPWIPSRVDGSEELTPQTARMPRR